jgi:hypothetical protein
LRVGQEDQRRNEEHPMRMRLMQEQLDLTERGQLVDDLDSRGSNLSTRLSVASFSIDW